MASAGVYNEPPVTASGADTHLLVERDGRTAWITVNRPDARNAMTFDMYDRLHAEARVRELAHHLAGLAPLTLAAVKEATRRVIAPVALREAEDILLSCYLSADFKEGVRAFLEKRPADWQGR